MTAHTPYGRRTLEFSSCGLSFNRDNDATVGVQANKYEGYVVWINALVEGAGGHIVTDTQNGPDATVDIGGEAGKKAADVKFKVVK